MNGLDRLRISGETDHRDAPNRALLVVGNKLTTEILDRTRGHKRPHEWIAPIWRQPGEPSKRMGHQILADLAILVDAGGQQQSGVLECVAGNYDQIRLEGLRPSERVEIRYARCALTRGVAFDAINSAEG